MAKQVSTKTAFQIKTVINGIGMSREMSEKGYAGAKNEDAVLVMAKQMREKGFEVEVYRVETTKTRLF